MAGEDKLAFKFDDSVMLLEMNPIKNKLTPKIKCEIALDILSKLELEDLATHFTPAFNEMATKKVEERQQAEKVPEEPANENSEGPDAA